MFTRKTKEEEPKIEFLTAVNGMTELVPPVPMRKAMPNWIKKTPLRCPIPNHAPGPGQAQQGPPAPLNSNVPAGGTTIKACAGVIDIMKWGWMIPLWADHEMITFPDTRETGRYQLRPSINEVKTSGFLAFHQEFIPQMEGEYDFSPKLDSPWSIRTPPGYSIALLPLPFADEEFNQPWRVVPGIIDTDRYHAFNVLLKWRYEGRYLMEQGTPMCCVVPFKRTDADMAGVIKQVTQEEIFKIRSRGKGGAGSGDRFITMPYQKWRKQQELAEKNGL